MVEEKVKENRKIERKEQQEHKKEKGRDRK